jgi:hypothetical protein
MLEETQSILRTSLIPKTGLKIYVFNGPTSEKLAQSIVNEDPKLFVKGSISWGKFEDGFPNIFIEGVKSIVGKHVIFVVSFLNHMELLSQLSGNFLIYLYFQ